MAKGQQRKNKEEKKPKKNRCLSLELSKQVLNSAGNTQLFCIS